MEKLINKCMLAMSTILILLFANYVHADINDGLIAHWNFEGDDSSSVPEYVKDDSGEGNHGEFINDGSSYSAGGRSSNGRYRQAAYFDGASDVDEWIDIGTIDIDDGGSAVDEMTIAAWIKADSFPGAYRDGRIISKASSTSESDHYWMLSTIADGSDTFLRIRLKAGGTTTSFYANNSGCELVTGVWYHVAGVYNGSSVRLYINGTYREARSKTGDIDTDDSVGVAIGNHPDPTSGVDDRPWDGMIDDVRIYNRALSDAEIRILAKPFVTYDVTAAPFNANGEDDEVDTDAIRQAMYCAAGVNPATTNDFDGECGIADGSIVEGEVFIPAGTYYIDETIRRPTSVVINELDDNPIGIKGLIMRGEGCGGTAAHSNTRPDHETATYLVWRSTSTAYDDRVMFDWRDTSDVIVEDLFLVGLDPDTEISYQQARAIWVVEHEHAGQASHMMDWVNVHFSNADNGLVIGFIGTGSDVMGCEIYLDNVSFTNIDEDCIQIDNDQSVSHVFTRLDAKNCQNLFHVIDGGNVVINGADLDQVGTFALIEKTANNNGTFLFQNISHQGLYNSSSRQLLDTVTGSEPNEVDVMGWANIQFTNYQEVGSSLSGGAALCDIGRKCSVTFENSVFQSRVAELNLDATTNTRNRSYLTLRNCLFGSSYYPGGALESANEAVVIDNITNKDMGMWQSINCFIQDSSYGPRALADQGHWNLK